LKYSNYNIKKKYIYLLLFIFFGCNNSKKIDTSLLNGYWIIDHVSENNEEFELNDIVLADYYEIIDDSGWRTKVKPLINSKYQVANSKVFFKLLRNNEKISLIIKTPWDNWEEELIKLDSISLILKIKDKTYHYNRIK
tara:strand:- start:656 stop:1069 length:414 start_codon:yes stop_codon:yes gene_type:complete